MRVESTSADQAPNPQSSPGQPIRGSIHGPTPAEAAAVVQWEAEGVITAEQMRMILADADAPSTIQAMITALSVAKPTNRAAIASAILSGSQKDPDDTANATGNLSASEREESVAECIVICVDVSYSMATPFDHDGDTRIVARSRLDGVKQMFYGFRDRTSVFDARHHIGLLSYSNTVTQHTLPTDNYDVFEDVIDDLKPCGNTAIYKAITTACEILENEKRQHQHANLRVLVLSDGHNNCNHVSSSDAAAALGRVGAVCDCLIVGPGADNDLRKLVAATEGECFSIDSLSDAFETLESDAVVSLAARWNGAPRPQVYIPTDLTNVTAAPMKRGAIKPTKRKPDSKDGMLSFRSIGQHIAFKATAEPSTGTQKRLRQELNRIFEANFQTFRVFPGVSDNGDIKELKVAMLPKVTPYAGRVFHISVHFPSDYPFKPPSVEFVTPIYHFAVSTSGGLCLDILKSSWSPTKNLVDVFTAIENLILNPQTTDPKAMLSQRSMLSELFRVNHPEYLRNATADAANNAKSAPTGAQGDDTDFKILPLLA